ncbi:NAD(P)/FAD-dependent oxidoreductase [Nakamurella lactea]|uniref:NAD(P)/FAD-dependent oxidoreductase n=1 Tax=Nakamurella lactea TaxID=459515 RepID=UPI000401913D|nr:NAD(P)/FAD-dependent oxidoreductase [Nakamurella lactea]
MIDLTVAGGGPAGLFTALFARAAGLTVRVVEPRRSPIDKACGEGLMPGAVELLAGFGLRAGVELPGAAFVGIRYLDDRYLAEARFGSGTGWGMRRDLLQGALFRRAEAAGVEFVEGSVGDIQQDGERVRAGALTSRYLVAADGLHSRIRHALGLQLPDRSAPRWGLRRHLQITPWTDHVEVRWAAAAEAYLTPLGPDLLSVALLTDRRGSFDEQLTAFPELAERLKGVAGDQVRGAGPLRQRVGSRVAGRVLLVGDAAGYVDALTGEGIDIAARSARELIRCLTADRPADYERAWRGVTRRYRYLTGALLAGRRREPVRRRLVGAAARHPRLFRATVHQLTR